MKRFIYNLHSWLGIIAAAGLLIIGLTGSALVFKWEIDKALEPELVARQSTGPDLDRDAFLTVLTKSLPGHRIVGWGVGPDPSLVYGVYAIPVGKEEGILVYADPATGRPTKSDLAGHKTVGDLLLELHRAFFAGHVGEAFAGIFALMLCALAVTGVVIYRNFWKHFFRLRWKMSARIFFSDLHKMVGISSTIFNLILGLTGAWWNLSHVIGHLVMEHEEPVVTSAESYHSPDISFEKIVADARAAMPGYKANWITLPLEPKADITLYGSLEGQGFLRSDYGSVITFDSQTGALKSAIAAKDSPLMLQVLDAFRPLHFGSFGGLPVKILWCLGGLAPGILAASGTFLWWRRKYANKRVKPA